MVHKLMQSTLPCITWHTRAGLLEVVVLLEDELPDALISIFNLERTLTLETE